MRYGYSKELAAYVESVPQLARPIVETVVTTTSDIKDTKTDFSGADATASFALFDEGGIRLSGSGTTAIAESTAKVAGSDITSLLPVTQSPLSGAVVEWADPSYTANAYEIFSATAYLDPNTGGGLEVTKWSAALYRLDRVVYEGAQDVWYLQWLGTDTVLESDTTNGSAADVRFTFAKGQTAPSAGDPPDLSQALNPASLPQGPTTVMFVWARKGNGEVASNVSWDCDNNNSSVTSGNHTIYRFDFTEQNNNVSQNTLHYTASNVTGVPACAFAGNTGYSSATISWTSTGGGNDLDLGAAPGADTELELVTQGSTPSDTSIVSQIKIVGSTWTTFVDGDVIGVDKSADGGTDLSGITRQQTYDVRAQLNTSTDTDHTPRLFRIGVREVTRETVDGLVEIDSAGWALDPMTCGAEVPTLDARLYRDGVKDFRSWADSLFADNHLNDLLLRVWVGHPDLARRYWLHIDDFLVGTYEPGRSGIAVKGISPLQYVLKDVPPKIAASRDPIVYTADTLKTVYDDILTTQVGVAARYIGPGLEGSTSTTVTKTISSRQQAYDPLRQINFINGSALISSQGRFKVKPLFDEIPPERDANFPYEEVEVLAIDTGFDKRITSYDVPYGWDGAAYTGERENAPSQTVLDNLGPTAFGQRNELDAATAQWIEDSTTADAIGARMVENFLTGMCQIRFRSDTPKPWLEPGDSCAFEQDVYVGRDPRTGDSIRGRMWARGVITQCHDVMGREFTVWVRSWVDVIPSATATTRNPKYFDYTLEGSGDQIAALWSGAKTLRVDSSAFRPSDLSFTNATYDNNYLSPSTTISVNFMHTMTLPPGCTLTQVRARCNFVGALSAISANLYRLDEDLTATLITGFSGGGSSGNVWLSSTAMTESVTSARAYKLRVSIRNNAAKGDAKFGFVEYTYTQNQPGATI